ncbi:MAG: PfkB family carbohydrate kinase [Candidatus Limnocylindria bacterium]
MRDGFVIVDSHGPQLLSALPAHPRLLKVNASEAAEATGLPIGSPDDALRACRALVDLGAQSAVVTLGGTGSVGRDVDGTEIRCSLSQAGGSWSVGSGDAFLAAAAVRLAEGSGLATAMADATAAGAANSKMMGAGRFDPAEMKRLRRSVVIEA